MSKSKGVLIFEKTKSSNIMNTLSSSSFSKKLFMWHKVNKLHLSGLNKSQISRELGIDRGTVRRYLSMSEEEFLNSSVCNRIYNHKLECYENFSYVIFASILIFPAVRLRTVWKNTIRTHLMSAARQYTILSVISAKNIISPRMMKSPSVIMKRSPNLL